MVLALLLSPGGCGGEDPMNWFEACISSRGRLYEDAARKILADAHAPGLLRDVIAKEGMASLRGCVAAVLEARASEPAVFREFADFLGRLTASLENPELSRRGWLADRIGRFAGEGPENRFVMVPDPEAPGGWGKGIRKEKYSEEEVARGKARNRAARFAVLEEMLKRLDGHASYVQRELVDSVGDLWPVKGDVASPRWIGACAFFPSMQDASLAWAVRVSSALEAVSRGAGEGQSVLVLFLASEGSSDRDRCYDDAWRAARRLASGPGRGELANLLEAGRTEGWKKELIRDALADREPDPSDR